MTHVRQSLPVSMLRGVAWSCCLLLAAPVVVAQPAPAPPAESSQSPPLTEEVEALLKAVDGLAGRDEAGKAALREVYQRALASLATARVHSDKIAEFQAAIDDAPRNLASIQAEVAKPAADVSPAPQPDATLARLEQQLNQAEAELASARSAVTEVQAESTTRKDRRAALPDLIATTKRRVTELTSPAAGGDALRDGAEDLAVRAQRHAFLQEATRYEKELASYDARTELLPARRDLAQRRSTEADKRFKAWQRVVDEARTRETSRALDEAKQRSVEAARQSVKLSELADENVALAEERERVAADINLHGKELADRKEALDSLTKRFQAIRSKIKLAGLTPAMGDLLRKEYATLAVTVGFGREQRERRRMISDAQFGQLRVDDERLALYDIDENVRALLDEIDPTGTRDDRAELEAAAKELLSKKKENLDALLLDYDTNLRQLAELDRVAATLVAARAESRENLQEKILSVRSVDGSLLPSASALFDATITLIHPTSWAGTPRLVWQWIASATFGTTAATVGLILLLAFTFVARRRVHARLRWVNEQVRRIKTDAFSHTLEAFAWTLFLALPLSLSVFLIGKVLELSAQATSVVGAVGTVLAELSVPLLLLTFVRHAARRDGLAGAHLQWADATCRGITRLLVWFVPAYLVPLGIALVLQPPFATDRQNDSLGRLAFAVAMIVLAIMMKKLLASDGPVFGALAARKQGSILVRFRAAWLLIGVLSPLALFVLTAVGYDYTAQEIHGRLRSSVLFLVVLLFVYAMLIRGLDVARRRLALEQARKRREAARAEASAGSTESPKEGTQGTADIDLPSMNAQTLQLLRSMTLVVVVAGLWWIWAGLFPGLRVFERVQVYPSLRFVETKEEGRFPVLEGLAESTTGSNGAGPPALAKTEAKLAESKASESAQTSPNGMAPKTPSPGESLEEALPSVLTLGDLGLALLFLLLTTIAAKNVPGLVEIILLRRLDLDPGARYAVSTLARYAIVMIGVTLAFGALSISWSSIQWLAAALTFGLAFGLQEIFANFVSGLIMLFERPVRIGDIVTVGGVDGRVSRIRMRATTITDYNNRELIVPNREFITTQLVNWTLSDPVTREVVHVGFSYDTDPTFARDVLRRACVECPVVMRDPAPSVIFRGFGDSALLFEARVFIASRDSWAGMIDDLHNRIYRACKDAKLEIAFPQMDLHIRSGLNPDPPAAT